ncbi:MAG TPA: LysR substrate-binding domain-containing protein, partial [Vicinamibacterales bacterium]|nr:LysR substrate-binding domain-containing protein [Vicinamibacterales bacterium]
ASPDYLRERGTPTLPSELPHHSMIIGPAHPSPTFSFRKDGRVASVRVDSQLAITINEGATASAVAGLGIAASSENSARAEFEAGKLVRVLPDWDFGSMEVNALFVSGKTIKPAARAFADFLLRELRAREREALKLTDGFRTLTELLEQSASDARESDAEGGRPS